jgi:hypothetical protein
MPKLDLYKAHKAEYAAPKTPALIDAPPAAYLSIEGAGAPGGAEFEGAVGALYGVAFTVKMASKFAGRDYSVCKLEGLWHGGPPEWMWKLLIRTPDFIRAADLKAAVRTLTARQKGDDADRVRLERLREGRCVQLLHVGPYERVREAVERMREFAAGRGLRLMGARHEVYLSDPRRVAAARLRTIVRHAVR